MAKSEPVEASAPQKSKRRRHKIIDPAHIECIYGPPFPEAVEE